MTPSEKIRALIELQARATARKARLAEHLREVERISNRLGVLEKLKSELLAEIAADDELLKKI